MRNQEVSHWALCGSGGSVWDWGESACSADQSTGYATVACTGHLPGIISSSC